jgi:hypothetical protein
MLVDVEPRANELHLFNFLFKISLSAGLFNVLRYLYHIRQQDVLSLVHGVYIRAGLLGLKFAIGEDMTQDQRSCILLNQLCLVVLNSKDLDELN